MSPLDFCMYKAVDQLFSEKADGAVTTCSRVTGCVPNISFAMLPADGTWPATQDVLSVDKPDTVPMLPAS